MKSVVSGVCAGVMVLFAFGAGCSSGHQFGNDGSAGAAGDDTPIGSSGSHSAGTTSGGSSVSGGTSGTSGSGGGNGGSADAGGPVVEAGAGGEPPVTPPLEACAGKDPAYRFCDDLTVMECGEGGLTISAVETCKDQACVDGACDGVCGPGAGRCTEGGAETCSDRGQWGTGVVCTNQACVAGVCGGTCTPKTKRCTEKTPETCSDAGVWVAAAACNILCSGGACSGTCTPNSKQCNGQVPQTCDDTGTWKDGTTCTNQACDPAVGTCAGVCSPQSKRCSATSNGVEVCSAKGVWGTASACVGQACVSGACAGECEPNAVQCSNNGVQTCSASGVWGSPKACTGMACVAGKCVGSCEPTKPRCSPTSNGVEVCGSNGTYGAASPCTGQACVSGACTGSCEPNAKQCSNNGVQTCSAAGAWGTAVTCVNKACQGGACIGSCTPNTKQCNVNNVETCSSTGTWTNPVACVAPETCNNAQCSDVTPPKVLSITPSSGTKGVQSDSKVVITFSEAVNQASAQTAFTSNMGAVSYAWNGAGTVLTVTPTNPLSYTESTLPNAAAITYTVNLATSLQDLAGNFLAAKFTSAFTTMRRISVIFTRPTPEAYGLESDGSFYQPGAIGSDSGTHIGDFIDNSYELTLIDFDISSLPAALQTIEEATFFVNITITNPVCGDCPWGSPFSNMGGLSVDHVTSVPVSAATINATALAHLGVIIQPATASSGLKYVDATAAVVDDFQGRVARKNHSQYRLQFALATDGDSDLDLVGVEPQQPSSLAVTYLIP